MPAIIATVLLAFPGAAAAQPAVPPGTYSASAGGEVLHVRVGGDGTVEVVNPGDGRRRAGRALFRNSRGITAMLANGETVAIGPKAGGLQMALGAKLYALAPLPAEQFGVAAEASPPKIPRTEAAPAALGSLGGLSLSSAQGVSGYRTLTTFDFCSDGRFFYRFEELQNSQLGSASGVRNDSGTWSVSGSTLDLRYARAARASHVLQRVEDDVIALDGRRYAMERSSRCR